MTAGMIIAVTMAAGMGVAAMPDSKNMRMERTGQGRSIFWL